MTEAPEKRRNGLALAFGYFIWLMLAWTGAWLMLRALSPQLPLLATPEGAFGYWTLMKLIVWVAPALWLISKSGRSFAEAIGFTRIGPMLAWGFGIGAVLGVLNLAVKDFEFALPVFSTGLLNAVLIAPIVEEIAFRGGVLGVLTPPIRFVLTNTLVAAMFTASHFPGWLFQDRLMDMLITPIGGALTIFVLGWVFGWVVYASKTIGAGVIAHSVNNLTA
jgi:membrane protease YdiL (CAAX protease family)